MLLLRPALAFATTALLGGAMFVFDWPGSVLAFALPALIAVAAAYGEPWQLRRNSVASVFGGGLAFGWALAGRGGGWSPVAFIGAALIFAFVATGPVLGAFAIMRHLEGRAAGRDS